MISGAAANVMDFGAVGDGVTDDTAAIQACFDSLAGGEYVVFPEGTYSVTSTVTGMLLTKNYKYEINR